MKYLTNTFSPIMMAEDSSSSIVAFPAGDLPKLPTDVSSAVSHEVTAKILSALLGREVEFNRVNLILQRGDQVYAIIPGFRASETREFSREEVAGAGFRSFHILIS